MFASNSFHMLMSFHETETVSRRICISQSSGELLCLLFVIRANHYFFLPLRFGFHSARFYFRKYTLTRTEISFCLV